MRLKADSSTRIMNHATPSPTAPYNPHGRQFLLCPAHSRPSVAAAAPSQMVCPGRTSCPSTIRTSARSKREACSTTLKGPRLHLRRSRFDTSSMGTAMPCRKGRGGRIQITLLLASAIGASWPLRTTTDFRYSVRFPTSGAAASRWTCAMPRSSSGGVRATCSCRPRRSPLCGSIRECPPPVRRGLDMSTTSLSATAARS